MIPVAAISMCSGSDIEKNYATAFALTREAREHGARWIVLPEMFSYFGLDTPLPEVAKIDTEKKKAAQALAEELDVTLFWGSVCEKGTSKLVYNTSYVFGPNGKEIAKYRKIHLFNLYNEQGTKILCESDRFKAGKDFCVFEHQGIRIGLATCYDLRFGEMFTAMAKEQALDVIVLPSAFTQMTGQMHWEVLVRARAIEQQCYMLAANQVGHHYGERYSFGHSMVVDPLGTVIGDSKDKIAYGTIDPAKVIKARGMIPLRHDRRPDLFTL